MTHCKPCSVKHCTYHYRLSKTHIALATPTVCYLGCDHIGHSKTISATEKPYRPHGKSTSATTMSATKYMARRHRVDTSLFRVVHILNLNVKTRALDDRPKSSLYVSAVIAKMNVRFFKSANILLSITSSFASFHSFRPASLLLKDCFALSSVTPFYATLIDRF